MILINSPSNRVHDLYGDLIVNHDGAVEAVEAVEAVDLGRGLALRGGGSIDA